MITLAVFIYYDEIIQVELKVVLFKNWKFRPKKKVRNIFKKFEIKKRSKYFVIADICGCRSKY